MTTPKKTGQLDPVAFKHNLMIVVSNPDIPEGPSKESQRLFAGDIQITGSVWLKSVAKGPGSSPTSQLTVSQQGNYSVKQITGDETSLSLTVGALPGVSSDTTVTVYSVAGAFTPAAGNPFPTGVGAAMSFATVRGNNNELDNLEFTADLNVTFADGEAQIVILHSGGAYCLIRYIQEALPELTAFDITSSYQVGRTGFTSGETVNFSFTADQAITQIAIWPFDSVLSGGVPTGTPVYVAVSGASGTGSFNLPAAIAGSNGYVASGAVYAAARKNSQNSTAITSTSSFLFDNRAPAIAISSVDYPVGQEAIKALETVTVNLTLTGAIATSVDVNYSGNNYLAPDTPVSAPYTVTGLGVYSFTAKRGAVGYNGVASVTLIATNSNNGLTANANLAVDVQDDTYPDAVLTVNAGNKISTAVGGKNVSLSLASTVKLKNPLATVTTPQMTIGSWSTANDGYTWTATASIQDNATRGNYNAAEVGLTTAAASGADITGSYDVSGFDERVLYFAGVGSPYMNLGDPTSDYPAGLVVKDIATNILSNSIYSYDNINNRLVFTDYYDDNTGSLYAYVSQTPAP